MAVRTDSLPPRYTDVEHIARGGMGDVYRATDTVLGRTVAVKVLADRYAGDADIRRRFQNEGRAAARLSGAPSTVTIFDVGETEEQPFIVMEFLEGGSLEERLKAGRPSNAEVIRWLEQAAAALDAGHAAGVVHRDVKPGNLLLDGHGELHVADFGVASAVGLDSLTMTGMVLGTSGYLSPEQARGERATAASDLYALAVVAWELLTGSRPFQSDNPTAEAAAHANAPVPSLSPELDPVFQRALAKDPDARYPSAAAFVADLGRALEPATEPLPSPPGPSPRRKNLFVPVALLAGLGLLGGGLALAGVFGDDEPRTTVVTKQGQRETVTVTTEREPPPPPTPPSPTQPLSASEAARLNDEAFGLINQGRHQEALPKLERAIAALQGTGGLPEAYTSYNLAVTRLELGRCDGVIELLDRSQSLQRPRSEISRARQRARKQCT